MKHLVQRGELKRRVREQHLWNEGSVPDAYLQIDDETVILHVVTLRAYLSEVATVQGIDEGIDDIEELTRRVDELLMTELSGTKEFVEVTHDFIRVGINCTLIDDKAITQALRMVASLDSLTPGTMIQIGQLVQVYENKIHLSQRAN